MIRQGPIFVKIGQYLSLRPDLLPPEYCDELLILVDRVPAFSSTTALAIFKEDLGQHADEMFAEFNPVPVAAGSLAQVHEAYLPDGRRLAVKIQRPGVRDQIERALGRAARIARWLDRTGLIKILSATELIAEIRRWMIDELDFRRELANVQRLHDMAIGHSRMRIPEPFPSLSSGRIVTTEFLPGTPFSRLLRGGDPAQIGAPAAMRIDPDRLAANLIWSVLEQIFFFEFFHADPHPGNLLAMAEDVVGFVDFGLVEVLTPPIRRRQLEYLTALYSNDVDGIYRALLAILETDARSDVEMFRRDFLALTQRWSRDKDVPLEQQEFVRPVYDYMTGLMRAARHRRLRIPTNVLALYRALLTAETVAQKLGGNADLRGVGAEFFEIFRNFEYLRLLTPENYRGLLTDILSLVRNGPGNLTNILSDLADERLILPVKVHEQQSEQRQANARFQLLSISILMLSVAVLFLGATDFTIVAAVKLSHIVFAVELLLLIMAALVWRHLP